MGHLFCHKSLIKLLKKFQNKILATGFPLVTQKQRYFNLVLNSNGYIKEITCLTTEVRYLVATFFIGIFIL